MWDLWAVATSAFVSATLFPGASEAVLAAALVTGSSSAWALILVATIANVAGSMTNWAIGYFLARYRYHPRFPISPKQYDRAAAWYARYGIWSLLASWVPVIGDPLTAVAGLMRAPFWPALAVVTIAKGGRYLVVAGATLGLASVLG